MIVIAICAVIGIALYAVDRPAKKTRGEELTEILLREALDPECKARGDVNCESAAWCECIGKPLPTERDK